MRRPAFAVIIALLLALLTRPAAAMAAPVDVSGAFGGFRASAMWWFPPEGDGAAQTFAFAEVYQAATTTDGGGIAVIGMGACVQAGAEDTSRICRGAGFAHELVAGEFEVSPTLDSARVDYFQDDDGYHVTWKATDPVPTVTPSHGWSDSAVAAGGKIFRNAAADGTIRGMALDQAVSRTGDLSRGGGFGASLQPSDGRVEVRFDIH